MSESDVEVEIENLDPQPVEVIIRGKSHTVNPPRFPVFVRLQTQLQKMINDGENLSDEQLEEIDKKVTAAIVKAVPSLDGVELYSSELMEVATTIIALGTPRQVTTELQKRGIIQDNPSKKAK